MRKIPFVISTVLTIILIWSLNKPWGSVPAIGKFISPQHGFWQNAEDATAFKELSLNFPQLKQKAEVYFDDRMVPHVFAQNDEDAYFIQGYLHAKFRLWQMEFQTHAAAGRISEILGNDPRFIRYDRETRRLGMVYAAENALKEIEKDPVGKACADSYTAGVNAYIVNLTESELPVEYKLLGYKPEKWTNLKIALLLKQMTRTLADFDLDLEKTNAKSKLSLADFDALYPPIADSLEPIIPKGTLFPQQSVVPVMPVTADSLYFEKKESLAVTEFTKQNPANGSNNWAVSGKKSKSGAPILCGDPHLDLTLPSIWYEMQITVPGSSTYGASLPGTPYIIIGFNDDIAWSVTNAGQDVKDYYEIKFRDVSKKEYWFNNEWTSSRLKIETIKVKGALPIYDTVAYTIFGPVIYDQGFTEELAHEKALAVRWSAHDPSNEANTFYQLNRAKNYMDYEEAIRGFTCPAQNFVFASRSGDIAIWQQGRFPARWNRQGMFVMPGNDSSYMWQGSIPQGENPHILNPERGFVESANQRPVDSTYPYYIPGDYIIPRGITITKNLSRMEQIVPEDMMALQNSNYNVQASYFRPVLLKYIKEEELDAAEKGFLSLVKGWDLNNSAQSKATTVYQSWFDSLEVLIWKDELNQVTPQAPWPNEQTLIEALLKDSAFRFIDNINTTEKETLYEVVTSALKKATPELMDQEKAGSLEWAKHKNTTIYHLLRSSVKPFARAGISIGGGGNIVNAVTHSHGPSWKMIVHLTDKIEAYGVYPGGQSGNPGSKYYDNGVDVWAAGKYNTLWMMREKETKDKRIMGKMMFDK